MHVHLNALLLRVKLCVPEVQMHKLMHKDIEGQEEEKLLLASANCSCPPSGKGDNPQHRCDMESVIEVKL